MDDVEALELRLERERRARREAEQLLEEKSSALYAAVEESKQLTEELRKTVGFQTRELLKAQRVAHVGTFILDIHSNLLTWSDSIYSILGIDAEPEPLTVERYLAAVVVEDRVRLNAQIDAAVRAGLEPGSEYQTTHRIERPDGEIRWVKGIGEVTESSDKGAKYLVAALQDITELAEADLQIKQAQDQLGKRLEELERTQKILETARAEAEAANLTKSRFIAMISHEIRTPINGLLGTLSLLQDSELDSGQQELLRVALASGEALRALLNDVLDFSRLGTGSFHLELTRFSVRKVASQMIEFWRPQARAKGNEIHLEIDPAVPKSLIGDSARIGQVLNNLLSNAIKFTGKGSISVTISVEGRHSSESSTCCLRIEIADTGIGIAREDLPDLFKEFSQVDRYRGDRNRFYDAAGSEHGAGLGLAICRSLVDRMEGKISVSSAVGEGTTFVVRLPLAIADEEVSPELEITKYKPLTTRLGKKPRTLIAEDIPTNQLVARMLLEKFGCNVEIASDGIEAVDACRRHLYDFVLMDVSMPQLDGVDATAQIRAFPDESLSSVPIIGLTAFVFDEELERFHEAGMNCVISKPIQKKTLYDKVRAALSGDMQFTALPTSKRCQGDLNHETFAALIKGFSDEQVQLVLEQFSDDLDEQRQRAISSAKGGDLVDLGRSCHAINGLAASFGGEDLADLARQIEELATGDDGDEAFATTLDRLGPATDAVLSALEDYAASLTADLSGHD